MLSRPTDGRHTQRGRESNREIATESNGATEGGGERATEQQRESNRGGRDRSSNRGRESNREQQGESNKGREQQRERETNGQRESRSESI